MGKINIIGPGYTGRSKNLNASRCINLFPVLETPDSKSVAALVNTPGSRLFSNTGKGVARAMYSFNNKIYFVAQNKLYSIDGDATVSAQLGSDLSTSSGRVSFADNGLSPTGGNEIAVVDGSNIYVWNVATETMTITSIQAQTVCFIGGYFVVNSGGANWRVSDLYDGTTWNPLEASSADASPDNLVAVFNNHNELWLFGEYTTEIWYQSGSGSPPFARMSGGVVDYGCAAKNSIAQGNNTIIWLGTKRNNDSGQLFGVLMAKGYGATLISPDALNYTFSKYVSPESAFAYTYTEDGHEFYVITFPTDNATWVYDTTTSLWHERSTYNDNPYLIGRHLSNGYAYLNGEHYISDYRDSNIYKMGSQYYDDNTDPITSIRVFPHMADKENLHNVFVHKFQIDAETGIGIESHVRTQDHGVDTITTGTGLTDVLCYNGYAYIADKSENKIIKLNIGNNNIEKTIAVGTSPWEIVLGLGSLWVVNYTGNTISRINPITDIVEATISVGNNPWTAVCGENNVYVTNETDGTVSKISADSNAVTATIGVGPTPQNMLYDEYGYLYVANWGSNTVSKIDTSTNTVIATISVGTEPYGLLVYNDSLWVVNHDADNVSRINRSTNTVIATISAGNGPWNIIEADGSLWVNNFLDHTITRINPTTNAIEATITVGTNPHVLHKFRDYIWVPSYGDTNIKKINTGTNAVEETITLSDIRGLWCDANDEYLYCVHYERSLVSKIQLGYDVPEYDPKAELSWSDDHGHTWSSGILASIGKQGEHSKRLIWRRLGSSRDKVFRVLISSKVKKVLMSAHVDSTGGYF